MLSRGQQDHLFRLFHIEPIKGFKTRAFAIGNDPCMSDQAKAHREANDKIALVATSGLRAISLACELGNAANTPVIYLIDENSDVHELWAATQEFFAACNNEQEFMQRVPEFIATHQSLYIPFKTDLHDEGQYPARIKYVSQDLAVFFQSMFDNFTFDMVKQVTLHARTLCQDWRNADVFAKLKLMIDADGIKKIFVYASNIVPVCKLFEESDVEQVLNNIHALQPALVIHTNLSRKYEVPKYSYFLQDSDPKAAQSVLFEKVALHRAHTVK